MSAVNLQLKLSLYKTGCLKWICLADLLKVAWHHVCTISHHCYFVIQFNHDLVSHMFKNILSFKMSSSDCPRVSLSTQKGLAARLFVVNCTVPTLRPRSHPDLISIHISRGFWIQRLLLTWQPRTEKKKRQKSDYCSQMKLIKPQQTRSQFRVSRNFSELYRFRNA